MTRDEAQRRYRIFYETVKLETMPFSLQRVQRDDAWDQIQKGGFCRSIRGGERQGWAFWVVETDKIQK